MINTYYWNIVRNFGDLLTPLLLERYCHLPSQWTQPAEAQLVVVGSILEHLPKWDDSYEAIGKNPNIVIAGAGKLHEASKIVTNNRILALRGPLTLQGITRSSGHHKMASSLVLADPGLLADELIPEQDKIYNLGLVPHWSDKILETNPLFLKYNPKIIRVSDDPLKVITEIAQCKKIVSSSLHGIILADAFGIPRRIELPPLTLAKPRQEGGIFKWEDYSLSIGMELKIGITQDVDRNIIIEKQHELFDVFEEIKSIFS